ncbi:phosphotriesterase [Salmonella enterica subsp. enterica serovar Typhimurium]|nr:phosphotriesterase [Salmonella enterica subsp. enterica serovar Typhimurium]
MLDRGVWLEFDMIGLDITFPKEGVAPGVQETADAVANLIALGYADQIVLSHDVFLKQMWAKNGGNGWGVCPECLPRLSGCSRSRQRYSAQALY